MSTSEAWPRTVVLVEGESDRAALLALADVTERDLGADHVVIVAMGGVTNTRAHILRYGPRGLGLKIAGLYDAPEEGVVERALVAAGMATRPVDLTTCGFFRCDRDLEEELIRALGADAVEAVIADAGEAASLRRLAQMPAQRDWTQAEILRRFMGSKKGRKARYADLLVRACPPGQVPSPLSQVLARV